MITFELDAVDLTHVWTTPDGWTQRLATFFAARTDVEILAEWTTLDVPPRFIVTREWTRVTMGGEVQESDRIVYPALWILLDDVTSWLHPDVGTLDERRHSYSIVAEVLRHAQRTKRAVDATPSETLTQRRDQVLEVAREHGATTVQVTGAGALGVDTLDDWLHLVIDVPAEGRETLRLHLEQVLSHRVTLLPPDSALDPAKLRDL